MKVYVIRGTNAVSLCRDKEVDKDWLDQHRDEIERNGFLIEREFKTQREIEAYIQGLNDAEGMMAVKPIVCKEPKPKKKPACKHSFTPKYWTPICHKCRCYPSVRDIKDDIADDCCVEANYSDRYGRYWTESMAEEDYEKTGTCRKFQE